jgi:hypothetical protein
VTYDVIPTIEGVIGIASYGPTATLFTLGRSYTAQQYDITPNSMPIQVQNVQHVPANTPPTPPTTLEEQNKSYGDQQEDAADAPRFVVLTDVESSADEGGAMSPLQKIAMEMDTLDQLESELRDKVMPLSPVSSRASSVSSKSSHGGRRQQRYLYDQPSSRASSNTGYDGTEFSFGGPSIRQGHDNMSIRSGSTRASRISNPRPRTSGLRKEILRSPQESQETAMMDLFSFTKARIRDLPFKIPNYGNVARTPDVLQREMLNVVFGCSEGIHGLVRDEMKRHRPGSASGVMLAKWLGEMGADTMASMIGSESMTSSDWMLLALSSIGQDSQKKVGEAFVQRLLEKGDIHPAVAILLGLGEQNDAIEVYVSQGYLMEAVILTCLSFPSDWGRQSFLLRKWGEVAVQGGQPELAVRIFSCASVEMSEPWFSPRAQDAVYAAQQIRLTDPTSATSPPLSPPSVTGSGRLTARNASLKLITSFGAKGAPLTADDPTPLAKVAATPIAQSAISPLGGGFSRLRTGERTVREQSEARTATPGGFRNKRLPSANDIARAKQDAAEMATPQTAAKATRTRSRTGSRQRDNSSVRSIPEPTTALGPSVYDPNNTGSGSDNDMSLPPPSHNAFRNRKEGSRKRTSREKKPDGLMVDIREAKFAATAYAPGPSTHDTSTSTNHSLSREQIKAAALSPPLTANSLKQAKNKAIDAYISSVEEARVAKRQERAGSRVRGESQSRGQGRARADSRTSRASSRARDTSEGPRLDGSYYIQPGKRSPSSPVPMSPEEIAQATFKQADSATTDDESFYKIASPINQNNNGFQSASQDRRWSGDDAQPTNIDSRISSRQRSPDRDVFQSSDYRGRGDAHESRSVSRSPSPPLQLLPEKMHRQHDDTQSDGRRIFVRSQNSARHQQDLQARRATTRTRDRSTSRRPKPRAGMSSVDENPESLGGGSDTEDIAESQRRPRTFTRKQLAAKELEERRLSLARRPSAPLIPTPGALTPGRPKLSPRSHTELSNSPHSFMPPLSRSATVDPEAMSRYGKTTGTSTTSAPIGLPATPRAMRHPRYMNADPDRDAPPVPEMPDNLSSFSGSNLSQLTGSNLSHMASSSLSQAAPSSMSQVSSVLSEQKEEAEADSIGPLLPSTVFGMSGPQGPARSASAPPEKLMGRQVHPAYHANLPASTKRLSGNRGHVRKISPPSLANIDQPGISSIDQALYRNMDQDIIIVPEEEPQGPPIMLPQLQHLAGPPPPPPPPTMFQQPQQNNTGVIDVNVDSDNPFDNDPHDLSETPTQFPQSFPAPMSRAQTVSPSMQRHHRRGSASTSDTFGSRMRGVADKMRSSSRNRGTNQQLPTLEPYTFRSPYETVLPPMPSHQSQKSGHSRKLSISRAKSPYEQAMADQAMQQMPPPPPPPPAPPAAGEEYRFTETVVPPRSQSAMGSYKSSRNVQANMPPSHLQPGVYTPMQGGFL